MGESSYSPNNTVPKIEKENRIKLHYPSEGFGDVKVEATTTTRVPKSLLVMNRIPIDELEEDQDVGRSRNIELLEQSHLKLSGSPPGRLAYFHQPKPHMLGIDNEVEDCEVSKRLEEYAPQKRIDLSLKTVNQSISTIKPMPQMRIESPGINVRLLKARNKREQMLKELPKNGKEKLAQISNQITFMNRCMSDFYSFLKRKRNWEEESFEGDIMHDDDHLPQYRIEFNRMVISRLKFNSKIYKMNDDVQAFTDVLQNHLRVKNMLPLLFKERILGDFMDITELQIEYPLVKYIRTTMFRNLNKFQEKAVVNYFGEKITLLFAFNNYFRDWLVILAVPGLLFMGLDFFNRLKEDIENKQDMNVDLLYKIGSILFACLLTFRKARFIVKWSHYERNFAERYGQSEDDQIDVVRAEFHGTYVRSVISDQMNSKIYAGWVLNLKVFIVNFLMIVWGVIVGVACYYLLMSKRYIDSRRYKWDRRILYGSLGEVTLDFAEFIRIKLFDLIFLQIAKRMSKWQNFKIEREYELDLSLRLSISQLVNNSMIIWLIFYDLITTTEVRTKIIDGQIAKEGWSPVCFGNDCEEELTAYFLVYTMFQLLWAVVFNLTIMTTFSEFIYRFKLFNVYKHLSTNNDSLMLNFKAFSNKLKRGLLGQKKDNDSSKHKRSSTSDKQKELLIQKEKASTNPTQNAIKEFYQDHHKIYRKVNMEIEKQLFLLEDYTDKDDFDRSSFDYLYMVNSFSYLVLYGNILTHSFALVWLLLASEYAVMRRRLFLANKRPIPKAAGSIGMWMNMIKVVSSFSIFTNSIYIAFVVFKTQSLTLRLVILLVSIVVLALIDFFNNLEIFRGKHWTLEFIEKRNDFISSLLELINRGSIMRKTEETALKDLITKPTGDKPPNIRSTEALKNLPMLQDDELVISSDYKEIDFPVNFYQETDIYKQKELREVNFDIDPIMDSLIECHHDIQLEARVGEVDHQMNHILKLSLKKPKVKFDPQLETCNVACHKATKQIFSL